MRKALIATVSLFTFAGVGAATVASAAPTKPTTPAGIFCPYFQNPTVQYVAHTICTR